MLIHSHPIRNLVNPYFKVASFSKYSYFYIIQQSTFLVSRFQYTTPFLLDSDSVYPDNVVKYLVSYVVTISTSGS